MRAAVPTITAMVFLHGAAAAYAQAVSDWRGDPVMATICRDESGCRNIPNYRYDDSHTAGGKWQITDTNWRAYAPQLDIDLIKYPNAGSAPEDLQGQVGFLMKAREGILPWVPYNARLRRDLHMAGTAAAKSVHVDQTPDPVAPTAAVPPHDWDVFPDSEDQMPSPTGRVDVVAAPTPDEDH